MKVLIIGSGGREHAIAWKLSESALVDKIYCASGNGGTSLEHKVENIDIFKIEELLSFAIENKIDVTVVGPEVPLVDGIVDEFNSAGLKVFGPSSRAARLEGSKVFAKDFMKKYGVKTAEYQCFKDVKSSLEYLRECSYPVVIKADGLAAGKGVVICENSDEAKAVINSFMVEDIFHGAAREIVIEEFLQGVEASILSVTDGNTIIPFLSAKDHKTIFEDNRGPNTGGMGVICPNPYCDEEFFTQFKKEIMDPTLGGIRAEKMDYKGVIFFGVMITAKGVYLLEYNVRMGDPETQAVLPLIESDFMELILSALNQTLKGYNIKWKNEHSCCIVVASSGYPEKYETGFTIEGIDDVLDKVFFAGVSDMDGRLVTSAGRVLSITATGKSLAEAREKAYDEMKKVHFHGMYYRRDIGVTMLKTEK